MKKVLILMMSLIMAVSLLAGGNKVEITALIGKPEIIKQVQQMVEDYNQLSKTGHVTLVSVQGQNWVEGVTTLYASKNAPTIIGGGEAFDKFKDTYLDLSKESWMKNVLPGLLDKVKVDNKILGMPVTVEAYGLIYNKKVLDEAVGGSFDPATIKTRKALEELFKKIEAKGKKAVHLSPMDWSLGAHLSNMVYTTQSKDRNARHQFLADLKAGKVDLNKNKVYNGWVTTFDLLKKYNSEKDHPLTSTYDDGVMKLSAGKVGFWFMGNWAGANLKEADPKGEYGFLPVPISDNAKDYGNRQISVGVPGYYFIEATQSSKEQQEEAKKFLSWMVTSAKGQDYIVNQFDFIPVISTIKLKPTSFMNKNVLSYLEKGNSLEWMNNYYTPNIWPSHGASMQKYLSGKIDKEQLANELETAWKEAK